MSGSPDQHSSSGVGQSQAGQKQSSQERRESKPKEGQGNGPSRELYEVEIGGIGLRLRTSYDQETVDDLVKIVNERFKEALSSTKSGSIQTAAILTALNLAEENLLLKKRANIELDDIQNKARRILSGLESSKIPKTGLGH